MRGGVAIIIVAMKPSDRTSLRAAAGPRGGGLLLAARGPSRTSCCASSRRPRTHASRNCASPIPPIPASTSPVTGGTRPCRRRKPHGQRRIRMGQRLLTADAAEIDAEKRSVSLKGIVEYLDPTLHVRGQGGNFEGQGARSKAPSSSAGPTGTRRGRRGSCATAASSTSTGSATRPARPATTTGNCVPARSRSTRRRASARAATCDWISWACRSSTRRGSRSRSATSRKTGLLLPDGRQPRGGHPVVVPWYWSIAPKQDLTFSPRYRASRGCARHGIPPAHPAQARHAERVNTCRMTGHEGGPQPGRVLHDVAGT